MGDDDHGALFFGQAANGCQYLTDQFGVQGRSGLVEENYLGLHCQGAGNCHPLLLATGQLARVGRFFACQTDFGQQLHAQCDGLFTRCLLDHQGAFNNVLQCRAMGEQVEVLEHEADLLAQLAD
ncbi:hypothetical protein D3C77_273810 [compost metagenome]